MKLVQILYPADDNGSIIDSFVEESESMKAAGFIVGTSVLKDVNSVIVRGYIIWKERNYPKDEKIIQGWKENKRTLFMEEFYNVIENSTMPTVFVDELLPDMVKEIANKNHWERVFIKSSARSLFAIGDNASVWPDTTIETMMEYYQKAGYSGPFAVRKFIDDPEIFYNEQRYWVLNGIAHHPSGVIPDFVREYAQKMYKFSGSHYFTMDVAGDYIVEINPGESSDRGGDNPLDWFCETFAHAFIHS